MSLYSLELPKELLEEIQQMAQAKQLSLEEWFLSAIAQRLAVEKAQQRFQHYARKADLARFDQVMARVPDIAPLPGDELI
jgi:hypothetical protein